MATRQKASTTVTVVRPRAGLFEFGISELWRSRELLGFFTWRDIKVRYKQAVLGILWALISPFMKMVVFSVVFGRLAGIESEGYPYPLFLYAGLLPWEFFSAALARSSQSVVMGRSMLTKVYFPRLIFPVAAVGAHLVDFAISFAILIGMMVHYHFVPGLNILAVLPLTLLTIMAALSVGILVSALNTAYRDFRHLLPFMVQLWMFLSPVIYPVSILPERFRWVLWLNPLTGIIDGYRYAILGRALHWPSLAISIVSMTVVLFFGLLVFRRTERRFADIV